MKRLLGRKREQLNNRGVTLVELLICMTMLSIVVGAFYSCFVLSAKTNARSRLNHKATTLAENTLENIKAEDMDTLLGQIQYPAYTIVDDAGNAASVQNFRLINDSSYALSNIVSFAEADKPYAFSNDGGIHTVYNDALAQYRFCMRNVKLENTSFDVLVTVQPSAAVDGAGDFIGSKSMVHIPSIDSTYDAVISDGAVYDKEALSYFELKGVYDPYKADDDNPVIHRTITIKLVMNAEFAISEVNAAYHYVCAGEVYQANETVFSRGGDAEKVFRNIFVFFNPHFSWVTGDGSWTEKIVVDNYGDYETDLYLIKQQPTLDETALAYEESNVYSVDVEIWETGNVDGLGEVSAVDIKTNLGYSFKQPTVQMSQRQARYFFNGTERTTDAVSFFGITAVTNKEEAELLYDVNIKIYQGDEETAMSETYFDGKQPLAELSGTLRN